MEYIQCAHCGKRYAVSEQIRAAVGQFTTCKSCHEKFLIVIHSEAKPEQTNTDDVVSAGSWDPSLTIPEEVKDKKTEDQAAEDGWAEEEDDAAQLLAALQAKRKRQRLRYALFTVVGCCALFAAWFLMQDENTTVPATSQQAVTKVQPSAKEVDMRNADCRRAAAMKWLLDNKVMHGQYTADAFVRMLRQGEAQAAEIRKVCQNRQVVQEIIQAATDKVKPDWFKAEIEAIQSYHQ